MLKNCLFILILASCLPGCRPTETDIPGTPYNPTDNFQTKIIVIPEAPLDTTRPLLLAADAKKTWLCEFYSNRIYLFTQQLKDTFSIRNDLSYSIKNNILLYPFKLESQDKSFSIEILSETCSGTTDDEAVFSDSAKKIVIVRNKITLKGCISKVDTSSKK